MAVQFKLFPGCGNLVGLRVEVRNVPGNQCVLWVVKTDLSVAEM